MEFTLMHIVFFLKNGEKSFKVKLGTLKSFYTVGPIIHKQKLYNYKYDKILKILPRFDDT